MRRFLVLLSCFLAPTAWAAPSAAIVGGTKTAEWTVRVNACKKPGGAAGPLRLSVRLDEKSPGLTAKRRAVGSAKTAPLKPGQCLEGKDVTIVVDTEPLPFGRYRVMLEIGDWDGRRYVESASLPLHREYLKGE